MRYLQIGGRHIDTEDIREILMADATSAVVWLYSGGDPRHAKSDEVPMIQQYIREAN